MTIHVLGPAGTHSHDAALELFPEATIALSPNFDALFATLQASHDLGFVPIENSVHGSVTEVLDLLIASDIKMWRTHDVSIQYAFGGIDQSSVTKIASHSQALAHCKEYLRTHFPDAERFPVSSTAYAIELGLQDPSIGVLARESTMVQRGLPVIQSGVQRAGNTTRFAIVAKEDPDPLRKKTQMSIVIHPPKEDRPGLLHSLLTPFKVYDVNLTRIENRPTGRKLGDYNFFIDFEGCQDDARTQKVLSELQQIADLRILGVW